MTEARALILAAGRGERMRPLTDTCPKPLLALRGRRLIEWHLQGLAAAGVRDVVVNTAWLAGLFPEVLGNGATHGLRITYSTEGRDHGRALETAGGLKKALPQLGDVFWVVAGDVWAPDVDFGAARVDDFVRSGQLARLWMVDNPPHHPEGDFACRDGLAAPAGSGPTLTYSGIGLFRAGFVNGLMSDLPAGQPAKLRPYLEAAIERGALGAERYRGRWADVGTPQRLADLERADAATGR